MKFTWPWPLAACLASAALTACQSAAENPIAISMVDLAGESRLFSSKAVDYTELFAANGAIMLPFTGTLVYYPQGGKTPAYMIGINSALGQPSSRIVMTSTAPVASLDNSGMIGPVRWSREDAPLIKYRSLTPQDIATMGLDATKQGEGRSWVQVVTQETPPVSHKTRQVIYSVEATAPRVFDLWQSAPNPEVTKRGDRWFALLDLGVRSQALIERAPDATAKQPPGHWPCIHAALLKLLSSLRTNVPVRQ